MDETDRPKRPQGRLHEFGNWHSDPKFLRDVYGQALGNLIAALVIYVIAAYAGFVDNGLPVVIMSVLTVIAFLWLSFLLPSAFRVRKELAPLFITWNGRTDPASVAAKELYSPLLVRIGAVLASGAFLLLTVFGG